MFILDLIKKVVEEERCDIHGDEQRCVHDLPAALGNPAQTAVGNTNLVWANINLIGF